MSSELIASLGEGVFKIVLFGYLTALAYRVVGKKPGASVAYDEWYRKYSGLLKGLSPLLLGYAFITSFSALSTVASSSFWNVPESALFPAREGTTWIYSNDHAERQRVEVRVAGYQRKQDRMCVRLETWVDGKLDMWEHVVPHENGLYKYAIKDARVVPPVCVVAFGQGEQNWTYTLGKDRYAFSQKERVEVAVPLATYKDSLLITGQLEGDPQAKLSQSWFVRGVGFVRLTREMGDQQVIALSLKELRLP